MLIARRVGGLLLAIAAVGVWFGLAPEPADVGIVAQARLAVIQANDDANNENTEGAPQQAVVNGWTANDLLTLIAEQQATPQPPADQRPGALLLLAVIGIALFATTSIPATPAARVATQLPSVALEGRTAFPALTPRLPTLSVRDRARGASRFLFRGQRKLGWIAGLLVVAAVGSSMLAIQATDNSRQERAAAVEQSARSACHELNIKIPTEPSNRQFHDYITSLDPAVTARMQTLCSSNYQLARARSDAFTTQ